MMEVRMNACLTSHIRAILGSISRGLAGFSRSLQSSSFKLQAHWNHTSPHPSALTFAHAYNIDTPYPQSHISTIHRLSLGGLRPATLPKAQPAALRTTDRLTPTHGLLRKSSSKLHPIHKIRSRCLTAGCSLLVTTVDATAMDPTGADVRARRAVEEAPVEAPVEAAESTET
jgi:hypothetical protein